MSAPSASTSSAQTLFPDGLPLPRRYWAALGIILAIVMSVLDSTIVNIALPSIARDFRVSAAASIWVVNAYQLTILMLLLPLAALGEIVGYRRVSQVGLVIFTLSSAACALAPTLLTLSLARVAQGVGAAGIMSVSPALVRFTYPQHLLGRAIGINTLAVVTASAVGPTIASAILAVADWRWLFGVNVPIGILSLGIALRAFPDSPRTARALNYAGALLYAGAFGTLFSGLQSLSQHAATAVGLAQIALGVLLGWLLVRHELPRTAPLLPFDLLRRPVFALSVATSVCSFMAQMTALVSLPFEIQRLGHSAVETGLVMTPWPVALALATPVAGRLADRYPAGILGGLGLLVMATGLLLLAFFPASGSAFGFVWRMALCGLGFGFFQSPNNRTIMASAPRERSGAAGGMLSAARLAGQTLGAASVAILFRIHPVTGPNIALWLAAALALTGSAVSWLRLRRAAP